VEFDSSGRDECRRIASGVRKVPSRSLDRVGDSAIRLATRTDPDYGGRMMGRSKRQAERVLQPEDDKRREEGGEDSRYNVSANSPSVLT